MHCQISPRSILATYVVIQSKSVEGIIGCLLHDVKRNTKIDGLGPFKYYNVSPKHALQYTGMFAHLIRLSKGKMH